MKNKATCGHMVEQGILSKVYEKNAGNYYEPWGTRCAECILKHFEKGELDPKSELYKLLELVERK